MVDYDDSDDGTDYKNHHYIIMIIMMMMLMMMMIMVMKRIATAVTMKKLPFPGELMLEIVSSIMMVMKLIK
jgi:hypothetical protein